MAAGSKPALRISAIPRPADNRAGANEPNRRQRVVRRQRHRPRQWHALCWLHGSLYCSFGV